MSMRKLFCRILLICAFVFMLPPISASAEPPYTMEGTLKGSEPEKYPGVYYVKAVKNGGTVGIPSIAKQKLENGPTKESPAIIMGAAVPYEKKTGPTQYTVIPGGTLYPPYSYFRYQIIEEPDTGGGGGTHRKMSGFDGTYVIIRVDVSDIIAGASEDSYLHVLQKGNAALNVSLEWKNDEPAGVYSFSDGVGDKVASYSLKDNAAALKDKEGSDKDTPYVDVILMSSGTLVAGADTGSTSPDVQNADFNVMFYVDQTKEYNDAKWPGTQPAGQTKTPEQLMLEKYFSMDATSFKPTVPEADITTCKMMGSDLELEITNEKDAKPDFWSLRKAMAYPGYNGSPIKLICEAPVLEGLLVEGGGRHVILDVNSFDIQLANNQKTGAAALTVRDAKLTLMDGSNTTGAEFAVGNNAKMNIQQGGTLIIDKTCQLEVEYDAASVPAGTEPSTQNLDCGIINIESGGEIINQGVLTIEGTEGKPIDPQNPATRDMKDAILTINPGGKITNEGCLLSYGRLYNMGTIVNSGKYDDVIKSVDPDKGTFTYHKGIQISWKDDVTQDSVYVGHLNNGSDADGKINAQALLQNTGDIVLVPGILDNSGKVENQSGGRIIVCPVEEAIIPIQATVDKPTIVEKRIQFGMPLKSFLSNNEGGDFTNAGTIAAATAEIVNNGRTGKLTELTASDSLMTDMNFNNMGTANNTGTITLDGVYTFGKMTSSGKINCKVVVSSNTTQEGIFYDSASPKLTAVYNAAKTVNGNTNIWSHAACTSLTVMPRTQKGAPGSTVPWTVLAESSSKGEDISYFLEIYRTNVDTAPMRLFIPANKNTQINSPVLPQYDGNVLYNLNVIDGTNGQTASAAVTLTKDAAPPASLPKELVYNGKDQVLLTSDPALDLLNLIEYCVGDSTAWTTTVPTGKNAGTYHVRYRLAGDTKEYTADIPIKQRPVVVAADDLAAPKGQAAKTPTLTYSGLVAGESLNGVSVSCNPDVNNNGTYPITVTVNGTNPNYAVTSRNGTYTVTDGLTLTAKDKSGVFSDEITYQGFNIEVTAEGATIYYSTAGALTESNYSTAGATALKNQPAGAGTHNVWYYAVKGTDKIGGVKQVIIDKAEQKAPDKIVARGETYKDSADGVIEGLEVRAMEYRRGDETAYQTAYMSKINVIPGIYLIRRIGDDNHYPSPDYVVSVGTGKTFTVFFDSNGGSEVDPATNLGMGDTVPRPLDPFRKGYKFTGWYYEGKLYDFSEPVMNSITLKAEWEEVPPHVHKPELVKAKEPTCTENGNIDYYRCTLCSLWFEDAMALIEITDYKSVVRKALGHHWDDGVVTKEPTETEEGIRTYTCLRDGTHHKTVAIPVLEPHGEPTPDVKPEPAPDVKPEPDDRGGSSGGGGGSSKAEYSRVRASGSAWSFDASGWHYRENGSLVYSAWRRLPYNAQTYWYYFDEKGTMKTGWLMWNGSWYYLYPVSDGWMGRMFTGWHLIDGKWYYFETEEGKNQGHLYVNTITPDGFLVGPDGARLPAGGF